MKDFLAFAQERRSVRKFSSKSVSDEDIADCLLAASFAPSAGDIQPWEFVVIRDVSVRDAIVSSCEDAGWLSTAPVLVIILLNVHRAVSYHGEEGVLWSRDSVCAAIQNFLLAATSRGLGSCWVASFQSASILEAIGAPDSVLPVAVLPLGFSAQSLIEKDVNPLDQMTFWDVYGQRRSTEDINMEFKNFGELVHKRLSDTKRSLEESPPSFISSLKEKISSWKK